MKLEDMDKLQREFFVNVRAVQPALLVRTSEPHDAMASMLEVGEKKDWEIWVWDAKNGLHSADGKSLGQKAKQGTAGPPGLTGVAATPSPMATLLASLDQLAAHENCTTKADPNGIAPRKPTILFLVNAHRFLDSHRQPDILVQSLQQFAEDGKEMAKHIVIVCPRGSTLPPELDPLFTIIDHARPGEDELGESLGNVLPDGGELSIGDKEKGHVIEAGKGMTRFQFEASVSRCLVEMKGTLTSDYVWQHKVELVNRSPALTLYRGKETFDDLGGMEGMKDFAIRSLTSKCSIPDARARGIVIGGPPGTGKSAFCKALGNMVGRATLVFDVGALKGSLHGQTEQNLREVIDIADTMGRVILLIDEVEKALAGAGHDAQTSGGIMTGVLGTLLTWMSDHESEVYFVMSTNDVAKLPAPFIRAERIDAVFFLDLPSNVQKEKIWPIYLKKFEIADQELPDDENWTGAEIKSCCAASKRLGLSLVEACQYVVPVYKRIRDEIVATREYAKTSCLDAETGKVFDATGGSGMPTGAIAGRVRKARRNIQSEKV